MPMNQGAKVDIRSSQINNVPENVKWEYLKHQQCIDPLEHYHPYELDKRVK